jgi:hypothetical protein
MGGRQIPTNGCVSMPETILGTFVAPWAYMNTALKNYKNMLFFSFVTLRIKKKTIQYA